jgi:hypothetical protein
MKKRLLFLLPIAAMTLAGCDLLEKIGIGKKEDNTQQKGDDSGKKEDVPMSWDVELEFESGTEEEKTAILQAVNYLVPCMDAKGNDFFPSETRDLEADGTGYVGAYVKLSTSILVDGKAVELEWDYDTTQEGYLSEAKVTDYHKVINLNYPSYGEESRNFEWHLKKATCGSAATKTVLDYAVKLLPEAHPHEEMTIAQLNKVTDGEVTIKGHNYPSTFDMVDYNQDSPYFFKTEDPSNPDYKPDFHYVRVKGKVIYYAPDGNWFLLADGNQFAEIYAGSGLPLIPSEYTAINGQYVEVSGNLDAYKGNVQVGYVTRIDAIDKSLVTEPDLNGVEITSKFIEDNFELPSTYKCQKQAIDGFSNCIATASGDIDTSSIKDSDGKAISASAISNGRFTFDIKLSGDKKLTIAYDYHTDRKGEVGLFNTLKSKLKAGGKLSVKGTMRYSGNDEKGFILDNGNAGVWNLVPCTPSDIA